MSKHEKKLVAPIIITAIVVLYLLFFILLVFLSDIPWYVTLILAVILGTLLGVAVVMLVERIKEIRSGEEDDLSQY